MGKEKTIAEINEKIKRGKAVVVTAEEIISLVEKDGLEKTAAKVDVVTTGTFCLLYTSGGSHTGYDPRRNKHG